MRPGIDVGSRCIDATSFHRRIKTSPFIRVAPLGTEHGNSFFRVSYLRREQIRGVGYQSPLMDIEKT